MDTRSRRTPSIHWTFLEACRATWAGAPVVVAVSVVWALAALPVVTAVVTALPVPLVLVTLPFLLVTTGVFRVLAAVACGDPVEWRQLTSIDPGLALSAWCLTLAIVLLPTMGAAGVLAASSIGAVGALVLPLAFAYGAVRDRRGIAAVRGGLVLATVHPDLALTLAAMVVFVGFAVVVSAGALVLCVPGLVAVFACAAVAADLHRLGVVAP